MADEARNYRTREPRRFITAATLLSKNTTGAGTAIPLGGPYTVFSIVVNRATTGTAGGSTKPSWRLQGSIDGTNWLTIGAATRAVSSTAKALSAVTSTAGIAYVRGSINNFSTSSGANPDKVTLTVNILPIS